jgi:hypothetical protein
MPFETTIAAFATALADRAAPPPAATRGRLAAPDARRFSVYRNNVAVGLIGALEARFPVSRRIVGDDVFRAMARAFASARKPRSPVMIAYGQDFPEFAADFLASAEAPELLCLVEVARDVARLENAWVEAYHAEDASVATAGELRDLGPDQLAGTRIEFHPGSRFLRFSAPAASIWAASQSCDGPAAPNRSIGEDALITRPDCDVSVRILPALAYDFASRLREGATLIEAALAVDDPEFDFGTHLVGLVESGAAASILAGSAS